MVVLGLGIGNNLFVVRGFNLLRHSDDLFLLRIGQNVVLSRQLQRP
jgi:hypothetical protein